MQVLWGHPLIYSYQLNLLVRSNDRVVADRVMGHATIDQLWAFKCILIAWTSEVYVSAIKALPSLALIYHLDFEFFKKQTNKTHTLVNTHTHTHTHQLGITTVQNSATVSIGTV